MNGDSMRRVLVFGVLLAVLGAACAPVSVPPGPKVVGEVKVGSTVRVDYGEWIFDADSYSITWESCADAAAKDCRTAGGIQADLNIDVVEQGRFLRAVVSLTNFAGTTTAKSALVGPVEAGESTAAGHAAEIAANYVAQDLPPGTGIEIVGQSVAPNGDFLVAFDYLVHGIPVIGAQAVVGIADGEVVMVNGTAPDLHVYSDAVLTADEADAAAVLAVSEMFSHPQESLVARSGRLSILDPGRLDLDFPAEPTLVWRMSVISGSTTSWTVDVNATTGATVRISEDATSVIDRRLCWDAPFQCEEPDRSEDGGTVTNSYINRVFDGLGVAHEYFSESFGLDSIDGRGLPIRANVIPATRGFKNAAFYPQEGGFVFDDRCTTLDIIGHEYSHGVVSNSPAGGLENTVQARAINEGIADYFGELIERRHNPSKRNGRWTIAEDAPDCMAHRDLLDPSRNEQATASSMGDENWVWSGDHLYQNMGVVSRFAVLLTEGGESNVRGIGEDKAALILHSTSMTLTRGATFAELARQLKSVCSRLGGLGVSSEDCEQVDKSLTAVNMAVEVPPHPLNDRGFLARDPNTRRSVLVAPNGSVSWIPSGELFECLARTRVVWDIANLRQLVEPTSAIQLTCSDAGPEWSKVPAGLGGDLGVNVILRDQANGGENWLLNSNEEIQKVSDGGSYLCLARTNPVIWGVPAQTIAAWQQSPDGNAGCGSVTPNSCSSLTVLPNDDGSSPRIDLPMTIRFGNQEFGSLWVNNNGNVTFDSAMSTFTPFDLNSTSRVVIAPFFGDVDTRPSATEPVTAGRTVYRGNRAFCANWSKVGYYSHGTDKINSFQLLLVDRGDVAAGAFDIIVNYTSIEWETGRASGGNSGLGGVSAAVGFSNGAGLALELPGSRVPGSFINSGSSPLAGTTNSGTPGRYVWEIR